MNNYTYQKPEAATYNLRRVLGKGKLLLYVEAIERAYHCVGPGVLLTEGDVHKNQVRQHQ